MAGRNAGRRRRGAGAGRAGRASPTRFANFGNTRSTEAGSKGPPVEVVGAGRAAAPAVSGGYWAGGPNGIRTRVSATPTDSPTFSESYSTGSAQTICVTKTRRVSVRWFKSEGRIGRTTNRSLEFRMEIAC